MSSPERSRVATERVWSALPAEARSVLLDGLSPTDLQTLLLDVVWTRAQRVDASRLMSRWREDRFVRPAAVDPRAHSRLVAQLWAALPREFEGVELSPVAPLGSCAGVAAADQNRIISTVRGSEVVSDLTNVLALEAAQRRRESGSATVHLAAHHRVIRAQQFPAGYSAHFSLFALVSSARGRAGRATELGLLRAHGQAWTALVTPILGAEGFQITYSTYGDVALAQQILNELGPELSPLVEDPDREHGRGYYASASVKIRTGRGADQQEIGDGGFTDWTARLTADAKERCLVSCVATERLLAATATQ
ncbi:MAG TPA: hypothetical protein VLJ88_05280 [Propionibacteriaceae bacterium]|nr:hypothetical protein [Propionibacteriaceae bacterium]